MLNKTIFNELRGLVCHKVLIGFKFVHNRGSMAILLIMLGGWKVRIYIDRRRMEEVFTRLLTRFLRVVFYGLFMLLNFPFVLQFEFEEEERRANRPMCVANLLIDKSLGLNEVSCCDESVLLSGKHVVVCF